MNDSILLDPDLGCEVCDDNDHCLGNGYSARTDLSFGFLESYGITGAAL